MLIVDSTVIQLHRDMECSLCDTCIKVSTHLETAMGGINSNRDRSHCSYGNIEIRLALLLDILVAGHGGTDVCLGELALPLILFIKVT